VNVPALPGLLGGCANGHTPTNTSRSNPRSAVIVKFGVYRSGSVRLRVVSSAKPVMAARPARSVDGRL